MHFSFAMRKRQMIAMEEDALPNFHLIAVVWSEQQRTADLKRIPFPPSPLVDLER
jgi:hypothetical protein